MPSVDRNLLLNFDGLKLIIHKTYFLEISICYSLYAMPIFTFLSHLFPFFQISPETIRHFTFLNVISIKFGISGLGRGVAQWYSVCLACTGPWVQSPALQK